MKEVVQFEEQMGQKRVKNKAKLRENHSNCLKNI